jgi:hypothetical protein
MAWELQRAGLDFLVMNAPLIPRSSDVAAGLFNPLMFRKLRLSRMVEDLWPVMQVTYESIENHYGVKLLHPILSAKRLSDKEISEWERGQLTTTAAYIHAVEIGAVVVGLINAPAMGYISSSGYLDIARWLEVSKKDLAGKGQFIEDALIYKDMEIYKNKVIINNNIESRKIIFCEGAAVIHNPWFQADWFSPNKGEILEILAPGLDDSYILRDDIFILPLGNHRFKVGATYSHDAIDNLPSDKGKEELIAKLDKMISVNYEILAHNAGVRPAIKDRMPVLGNHVKHDNILIFNGLGSRGVVFAPYCAKVLIRSLLPSNESIPDFLNVRRWTGLSI